MQIERSSSGDLLEVTVQGVLDNESSVHFRDAIEESVRDGWHRILVDLSGVTYLSSAGIGAMLAAKKTLDKLHGLFGICNATPQVEEVLSQTRVLNILRCDPEAARAGASAGTVTLLSNTRIASEQGVLLEIYSLSGSKPLCCRVIGQPQSLFDSSSDRQEFRSVEFGRETFGLGLGAIGTDSGPSGSRLGEIMSVAGAVAQSPRTNGGPPDYSLAEGDFTPSVRVLYGVQCEGDLPLLIRFRSKDAGDHIRLSKLVGCAMRQAKCQAAGIVILAECAGLIGAQLRHLPKTNETGNSGLFAFPEIRDWLSFSAEQIHRQSLGLIVGIAVTGPLDDSSPLQPIVRPMDEDEELAGHFHAAVFPYRPLKKRTLNLQSSVTDLFQSGSIQDVLHLLRDDRSLIGSRESELFSGACWIAPIHDITAAEDVA